MPVENHGLKRELQLRDLVLMQILVVVGLNFSGFAAKQGRSQVVLWLLAISLFYLPQAAVVIRLSRAIPLEGGVYQWVKQGISPFAGYMAGWSFSLYIICWYASFGSQVASGLAYGAGAHGAWLGTSKAFTLSLTVFLCLLVFAVNVRGLHLTKWLSGTGSILSIVVFLVMAYLLVRLWTTSHSLPNIAFSLAWPGFSLVTLNVFTKMALFALSGFDQCSIFSEECRKPKNDVARSVFIAVPCIALMYIVATGAVLGYVPIAKIDLAAAVSQVMLAGFGHSGVGWAITAFTVVAFCRAGCRGWDGGALAHGRRLGWPPAFLVESPEPQVRHPFQSYRRCLRRSLSDGSSQPFRRTQSGSGASPRRRRLRLLLHHVHAALRRDHLRLSLYFVASRHCHSPGSSRGLRSRAGRLRIPAHSRR
jgi:amino acid transporter